MVDIAPVAALPEILSLDQLKSTHELEGMLLLRKGQRLSVQPVEESHFNAIIRLAGLQID